MCRISHMRPLLPFNPRHLLLTFAPRVEEHHQILLWPPCGANTALLGPHLQFHAVAANRKVGRQEESILDFSAFNLVHLCVLNVCI